jgi:adenine-specific DNA glycosylase
VVGALHRGDQLLFVQRPPNGLWASLWELPSETVEDGESPRAARDRLRRRLPGGCRLATQPVGETTRQLTHRRITFVVYEGSAKPVSGRTGPLNGQPVRWLRPRDLADYGVSRACEAVLALIGWSNG